jgi:predicted protein tyrosine phosphatase
MTQRFIENVSKSDVALGHHMDAGANSMLIRIQDPATFFGKVARAEMFKEVYEFEFLDAEDEDGFEDEAKISDAQAAELVRLLQRAQEKHMNVVVHCHAGICRSGAVVEVASMMGFTPADRYRQPNVRVKTKMMKVLGWTYDSVKTESDHGFVDVGGMTYDDVRRNSRGE